MQVYKKNLCYSTHKHHQIKKTLSEAKSRTYMDPSMAAHTSNYKPGSDLIQEDECDTLLLYLPGFTKEQLRVQLTSTGALRISGTRPIGDNKWSIFQETFPISANCDNNKITAKFEGGILYVKQPKLIVPAQKDERKIPPSVTPQPQTPPRAPKIDPPARPQNTTPNDDRIKKTGVENPSEKPAQKKQEKPTKEEEKSSTDAKGDRKDETELQQEKISDRANSDLKAAGRTTGGDNPEGGAGNIEADSISKRTKYHDIAGVEGYNHYAGSPTTRLKMSGETIKMVLAALFAFLLGMYFSNLSWLSKGN
ncbi:inactive protein RESTRICTED TEV MOVEMENT 2-like isoform X2 [Andrographis paniculata]|uniref:inactive protein RESTRICTED TEV MOVEMENT 2-like isoform X2 n=1 Tax=Andrographis paniculata TaxID=175694 RepID=UPI0021E7D554|nr:inactive protein RESTRICTED TEV MOVEMENT 2-like isoform X2 [Andrographis paniculata]